MRPLILHVAFGPVEVRAAARPVSADAVLIPCGGGGGVHSVLIAAGCLSAVVDACNATFVRCHECACLGRAPCFIEVHQHLFERLSDEAYELLMVGAPPKLPSWFHHESGRPGLFSLQRDWALDQGDDALVAVVERRNELWHRPPEEWELSKPVLLRGAYRTVDEADLELSWILHYAGRRHDAADGAPSAHRVHDQDPGPIIAAALRMLLEPLPRLTRLTRTAEATALEYSQAVMEFRRLPAPLRTPTQLAHRLALWMHHPRERELDAAADHERHLIEHRAMLSYPHGLWPNAGFTFLGRPR